MRRVVVTGMGCISPLGIGVDPSWDRLHKLENTVEVCDEINNYEGVHSHLVSRIKNFEVPSYYSRKVTRSTGPVSIMALMATREALEDSLLLEREDILGSGRTGVAYGSSFGSIQPVADFISVLNKHKLDRLDSSTYIKIMPHTTAVNISLYFKTKGRLIPTGTACTSGSLAVGYAYEAIKNGMQDVMIAGGGEEFSVVQVAIFDTLYATSIKNDTPSLTPSPYDKDRDGLVIGEGAASLILEEYEHAKLRGAPILAEVVGFYTNTDGTHVTQPNSTTMAMCMREAIRSSGINFSDVGYINSHGTGTTHGDSCECLAVKSVFGDHTPPMSSLKSYTGHTLGACGALESIFCIRMMNENWYHPTLNLNTPDEDCKGIDHIQFKPREFESSYVMNNNFAFGGINTSLIFKRIG